MAGVKYISKKSEERKNAAAKKAAEADKPAANSKAKVTKKPAVNGKAAKAAPVEAPKKRGRPKAAAPAASKAKDANAGLKLDGM